MHTKVHIACQQNFSHIHFVHCLTKMMTMKMMMKIDGKSSPWTLVEKNFYWHDFTCDFISIRFRERLRDIFVIVPLMPKNSSNDCIRSLSPFVFVLSEKLRWQALWQDFETWRGCQGLWGLLQDLRVVQVVLQLERKRNYQNTSKNKLKM